MTSLQFRYNLGTYRLYPKLYENGNFLDTTNDGGSMLLNISDQKGTGSVTMT